MEERKKLLTKYISFRQIIHTYKPCYLGYVLLQIIQYKYNQYHIIQIFVYAYIIVEQSNYKRGLVLLNVTLS